MSGQLHASAALPFLRGPNIPNTLGSEGQEHYRNQNTLKHNYQNKGIGTFMEAISFVVTIKQTTFIHSNTAHVYFNQLFYPQTYVTCKLDFGLTVHHQLGKVIQMNQLDATMIY
jgi:hypothetical protein